MDTSTIRIVGSFRALRQAIKAVVFAGIVAGTPLVPTTATALPMNVVSVTGPDDTFQFLNPDQAAAVSFTLDQTYSDVAISANVQCVACSGVFVLMKDLIGPSATLANLVEAQFLDVGSTIDPIMTLASLDAGTYFLILANTGDRGSAGWLASSTPLIDTAPGVVHDFDFFAASIDVSTPYTSDFNFTAIPGALLYSVVADDRSSASVPEAGSIWLLLLGLLSARLALVRRHRSSGMQ